MRTFIDASEQSTIVAREKDDHRGSLESQIVWDELFFQGDAHLRPKQIVIIDDEPKIRILFGHVLDRIGYETTTFGDNALAIKYINDAAHFIDLLVLDLDMPHVDGHYFCKMIRVKHPQAKVLIASNYTLDIQKYLILDADGYFDKSEGIQVLKERINEVLSDK